MAEPAAIRPRSAAGTPDFDQKCILKTHGYSSPADGFIGSHLVELLDATGAKVTALSQYNSFNFWGWLQGLPCLDRIHVVSGDIRDPHFCTAVTKDASSAESVG